MRDPLVPVRPAGTGRLSRLWRLFRQELVYLWRGLERLSLGVMHQEDE